MNNKINIDELKTEVNQMIDKVLEDLAIMSSDEMIGRMVRLSREVANDDANAMLELSIIAYVGYKAELL